MKCFPLSSSERISVSRNGSQLLGVISLKKIICYLNKEYGQYGGGGGQEAGNPGEKGVGGGGKSSRWEF